MNRYKIPVNLADIIVGDEEHLPDGSFGDKQGFRRGKDSVVVRSNIIPEIEWLYPGSGIKIFSSSQRVHKITQIQRIFSWYGLAPKVYKQIEVEDTSQKIYHAQVVEYAEGEYCFDMMEVRHVVDFMKPIAREHHLYFDEDMWASNIIKGRWLDFGNFDFKDSEQFKADASVKYNRLAKWGNNVNSAYQQFEEIGITSGRGGMRKEMFGLDEIDFKNKTVLDIGCSGGYFTNYCDKRGARAIGIDVLEVVEGAKYAANAAMYDTEFYPFDFSKPGFVDTIRRITGIREFDYVFFLSMDQHIGFKGDYFKELVGDTLFFESNGGKPVEEEYEIFNKELNNIFPSVDFKGVSTEGAKRNLFICKKHTGIN